jgi:hypothetical protein
MPPKTLLRALPWGPALKTSPILMGDQIPRVLSDSSSDYSLDLSLLIVRQTRPGGDDHGQVVGHGLMPGFGCTVQLLRVGKCFVCVPKAQRCAFGLVLGRAYGCRKCLVLFRFCTVLCRFCIMLRLSTLGFDSRRLHHLKRVQRSVILFKGVAPSCSCACGLAVQPRPLWGTEFLLLPLYAPGDLV